MSYIISLFEIESLQEQYYYNHYFPNLNDLYRYLLVQFNQEINWEVNLFTPK